ncbi:hypothetical protein NQ314_010929 [Rhamnusium bicolor]|uniref:HAT C-terminal dimerisation domain-containing protein n=1 Tax=Rhamnusium bicolor TaxID=1586634 RepID=A0AAV8XMM5_9CUCU|nr:hypothetical protein NQ314_010929 [Rhamnusium bicolor]
MKTVKSKRFHRFNAAWLVKSDKVCDVTVFPNKVDILRHGKSERHLNLIKAIHTTKSLDEMLNKSHFHKVRNAELKLAADVAVNNIPFQFMDILSPLCGQIFTDSKIAKGLACRRTKTTTLIKENIGLTWIEKKIPLTNLIGFASDTRNVMVGDHNSVFSHLKVDLPDIALVKCSCHLIHLCASKACLELHRRVEDLLRNIGAHFSRSFGSQEKFKEFQIFFGTEIHKILLPSQTRWLSLEQCCSRILLLQTEVYKNLKAVVSILLILPFSNASVERLFSDLNNVKTDLKNGLKTDSVAAILATKDSIKHQGGILKFTPTDKLINSSIWRKT